MSGGIVGFRAFGEIADFRNGVNFSSDCRGDGDLAVIGVGDFQDKDRISSFDGIEHIIRPKSIGDEALLRSDDLIFVRSNGNKALIGRCMKVENVKKAVTHSGFTIRARVKPGVVDPEWILQFFSAGLAARAIARRGGGTNISNLSQSLLQDLEIPIPDEKYQARVLAATRGLTAVRRQIEGLAEAKRQYKQGFAQKLLTGQKRLTKFRNSVWVEVRLGEIFAERSEVSRADLPLLSVTNDRGVIPRDQLDKRDTSNPDKSKYKRVAVGDIAYNTMRMWQGVSALSSLEGIVSPAYTVAIPSKRIDGAFAKHLFKFAPVVHLFHRHSQGLVDDTLNLKFDRFAKINVRIPSDVSEQRAIAEILDLIDLQIGLIAAQRDEFEIYKRGLLDRLLSGECSRAA